MSIGWDDLRVFLAVQRHGSHAGAGRALAVDATTVSRRLAALEQAVGARLFDRTPEGLALSDAGRALLPRAERVALEVEAAERELAGQDQRVAGPVRVTAGDGLVDHVLVPGLVDLLRRHPGLVVALGSDTRTLNLSRREADIAVRFGRSKDPALVERRLGAVRFGLYAAPDYLTRRGTPESPKDLVEHTFVGFDGSFDEVPQVAWLHRLVPDPGYAVRTNTTGAQLAACHAGLGLALLPTYVASPSLVRVLPRTAPPTRELFAVIHGDMRRHARVKLVIAWLVDRLALALRE